MYDLSRIEGATELVACAAWPVVTRITSSPRWLFFRLAVIVTLVLWLPDIYILLRHEPLKAVGVLMTMHLAIALITYNSLVHIAAVKAGPAPSHAVFQAGHLSEIREPEDREAPN